MPVFCTLDGEQQALLRKLAEQGVISAEEKTQILSWLSLPVEEQVVSEWQKLFGHLKIRDLDFNEIHYPLGKDPGDEAEELFGFDERLVVSGYRALDEYNYVQKRQPASLWAQGRYIKEHPEAQKEHPLLGIGAQWLRRDGLARFPIYSWGDGKPYVNLNSLGYEFHSGCHFLLRKEKGV